MTLKVSTCYCG